MVQKMKTGDWIQGKLCLFLLVLGCAGCHSGKNERMTFGRPQNVCVGRLQMTVPEARVERDVRWARIDGVDLQWFGLAPGQIFENEWKAHQKQLSTEGRRWIRPMAPSKERLGGISISKGDPNSLRLELWQFYPAGILKAWTVSSAGKEKMGTADLNRILDHFSPDEISASRPLSFCIEGGAVDYASQYSEEVEALVRVPMDNLSPEPSFVISMQRVEKPSLEELLHRTRRHQREALLHGALIHILRNRKRIVAGMSGEEAVIKMASSSCKSCYTLKAEFTFQGLPDSRTHPHTTIRLAGNFPSSEPPVRLIALWDSVLDSMAMGGVKA